MIADMESGQYTQKEILAEIYKADPEMTGYKPPWISYLIKLYLSRKFRLFWKSGNGREKQENIGLSGNQNVA